MPSTTISPTFEIKAENFDSTQVADSHLMIEVSQKRFRFCVFHVPSNAIICLEDYLVFSLRNDELLKTIKAIYQEHQFLSANYWKSIRLSINAVNFTLVPSELYSSEDSAKYLQLANGEILEEKEVFHCHHSHFESVTVFSIENELINWFREKYAVKKISPVHLLDSFLEGIYQTKNSVQQTINGLHLYFEEHSVLVVYFEDNKLQFCNKFAYQTPADLLYYILCLVNELKISLDILVILYGEITIFAENYILLEEYFHSIKFAKFPSNLAFSSRFEAIPEHRYFSLFSSFFIY